MNRSLIAAAVLGGMSVEADATTAAGSAASKPKAEVLKVKMSDGREVDFVGKRKLLKETIIEGSSVKVRLDFRNAETRLFAVPDGLLLKAAGHGMEQKLGDETAGEDDVDDMVASVDDLIARLQKGEWTTKREGGFSGASILVKALMEVTQKSKEEVQAFLKAKVEAGATYPKLAAAFEEDDTVGPVIKKLRKEKAAGTGVDTKSLLGSLAASGPATA